MHTGDGWRIAGILMTLVLLTTSITLLLVGRGEGGNQNHRLRIEVQYDSRLD